jgi:diguanylate cyclase (GGDEF)-like protein/PAS domain S-box-containing protein
LSQPYNSDGDGRIAEILKVIFKFAAGDLTARGTLSDDAGALDGVMAGINILGEELEAKVAESKEANDSLREALDYAQTLIRSSPDGIVAVDRDLRITEWNLLMEQMSGETRAQAIGRALDEIPFMQETGEAARVRVGFKSKSLRRREIAYRIPGTDKDSFLESFMAPLQNGTDRIHGAVLRILDITERKRAEEQMRAASLYARGLIEAGLDPMVTISAAGKIMDVNESAVLATGVPREQLIDSDFAGYFTDPDKAHTAYREAFANGEVRNFPLTMRNVSGKLTEVLYNANVYRTHTGEVAGVLAVARDITERKRAEQAEELARRDGLTGLFNHRTFYSLLTDETVRAQRFNHSLSLLMLDIDHFKGVNDTHGHPVGDVILKGLSDLLMKQARAVDSVCRYGGEEFAVILPEATAAAAAKIAERLRGAVEHCPFDIGGGALIAITVSIGVSTFPQQASSPEGLVKAADVALYAAKQSGRNRVSRYEALMAG